jgi:polysaccharide export outer membrane protein
MHLSVIFRRVLLFSLILALSMGCATDDGSVVTVVTVTDETLADLKAEELEQLEQIKKTSQSKEIDPGLGNVIQSTQHYAVADYVRKHPEAAGRGSKDYNVGGYDVLNIVVYEEEDLSREAVRVSADGYISFPLIGRIPVEGMSTAGIGLLISRKLANGQYLLDAHVSVMVTQYNSKKCLVLGAVNNPGSYPLRAQEKVLDGLSKAGGVESGEDSRAGKRGMIIRTENANTPQERKVVINLDLQGLLQGRDQVSNIFLINKDVLYIPTAEHFFIIGQVKNPGSYQIIDDEITLVEGISMAGGFTPIAARNKTRVIRVEDGVEKIYEIKVDAITGAGRKNRDLTIRPNDVIIVPESFF